MTWLLYVCVMKGIVPCVCVDVCVCVCVYRGLRDDLAAAKQRVIHLESQLKSRDRECERLQRSVDAARAGEMEAEVARAQQEGIVR